MLSPGPCFLSSHPLGYSVVKEGCLSDYRWNSEKIRRVATVKWFLPL